MSSACSSVGDAMLEVADLHAYYGSSHVVQGVSFAVERGEAVALMGRNGVGKTSTLKAIFPSDHWRMLYPWRWLPCGSTGEA